MTSITAESLLYEAGSIWKFLDTLAVSNPTEYKKYVDKILKDGAENDWGPPLPKFVVETQKKPQVIPVRKYFINIAEWKQVPEPKSKDASIDIITVEPRKEIVDKEWAMVIDIVLNPIILAKFQNHLEKVSIIELVLKHIENKYALSLSRKYKIIDDKYKGNQDNLLNLMCPSALKESLNKTVNVELSRDSVIEQVKQLSSKKQDTNAKANKDKISENLNDKIDRKHSLPKTNFDPVITANECTPMLTESKTKILNNTKSKLKTPKVEMEVNKEEGNMELTVYLPNVDSVQECDLEMTENRVLLTAFEKYNLQLDLPVCINIDESKAKFVKDLKILLITAPINVSSKIS